MSEDARSDAKELNPKVRIPGSARRLLMLIVVTYLMCLSPIVYYQRSLIYHPRHCDRLLAQRSELQQAAVDVTVKSFDGLDLHGWLALTRQSPGFEKDLRQTLANGRPVVLFFPGNAGDRSNRVTQITTLGILEAHVLLVDYRGYADNAGKPTEANFARDARSVWNYLTTELNVPAHRIVIYGESLGGGSATRLASELCQEGIEPGGLIAQSTFSSLVAAAQYHFPWLPVSLLLVDRFPSDVKIRSVTCPILQIHGVKDTVVPFAIGQKLFDAAPAASSRGIPKKQLKMPLADHNDIYFEAVDHHALVMELGRFLDEVANAPPPKSDPTATPRTDPVAAPAMTFALDWTVVIAVLIMLLAVFIWWVLRETPRTDS